MLRTICVCIVMLAATSIVAAESVDVGTLDKQISDTLRDVHNRGADLHNTGDPIGCYRMYQGGLMAIKPLLSHRADVQKLIDQGMTAAEQKPPVERAFALHTTMAEVRKILRPTDMPATDKIPTELPTPKTTTPSMPMPMPAAPGTIPAPAPKQAPAPTPAPVPFALNDPAVPVPLPTPTPPDMTITYSLWDRIGGQPKVEKCVDELIAMCVADSKVNLTRDGKYKLDEDALGLLKRRCVGYISLLCEGSVPYTGPSLKEVSQAMDVKADEWAAVMTHLKQAFEMQKVSDAEIQLLMKKIESAKNEVEARKPLK